MLQSLARAAPRRAWTAVARPAATMQMRTFIVPTVSRRADFVQELYLKELKAYKVPAVKADDARGQVATFALPAAPPSPEEADLASSLQEYESMAVEVEGQEAGETAAAVDDWLVIEEEDEEAAAHH